MTERLAVARQGGVLQRRRRPRPRRRSSTAGRRRRGYARISVVPL